MFHCSVCCGPHISFATVEKVRCASLQQIRINFSPFPFSLWPFQTPLETVCRPLPSSAFPRAKKLMEYGAFGGLEFPASCSNRSSLKNCSGRIIKKEVLQWGKKGTVLHLIRICSLRSLKIQRPEFGITKMAYFANLSFLSFPYYCLSMYNVLCSR